MEGEYFIPADTEHIAREKNKAKELRRSQWWKRKRSSGQCHYCAGSFPPGELTMDHVVPLSRGGLTSSPVARTATAKKNICSRSNGRIISSACANKAPP